MSADGIGSNWIGSNQSFIEMVCVCVCVCVCELGFARRPVDDEEEKREGYVVFH